MAFATLRRLPQIALGFHARTALLRRPPNRLARLASTSSLPGKPSTAYVDVSHPEDSAPAEVLKELDDASRFVLPVYARPPVLLVSGKGNYLYDSQGRKYLDFTGGIAVNALGHSDEQFAKVRIALLRVHAAKGRFLLAARLCTTRRCNWCTQATRSSTATLGRLRTSSSARRRSRAAWVSHPRRRQQTRRRRTTRASSSRTRARKRTRARSRSRARSRRSGGALRGRRARARSSAWCHSRMRSTEGLWAR